MCTGVGEVLDSGMVKQDSTDNVEVAFPLRRLFQTNLMCTVRVWIVLAAGISLTQLPLSEFGAKEAQMTRNCFL